MGEGQGDNVPSAMYYLDPVTNNVTGKFILSRGYRGHWLTCSAAEQLLWPTVQLAQRRRYQPPEQGDLLHGRDIRILAGLPTDSGTAEPGVSLQREDWAGQRCGRPAEQTERCVQRDLPGVGRAIFDL